MIVLFYLFEKKEFKFKEPRGKRVGDVDVINVITNS